MVLCRCHVNGSPERRWGPEFHGWKNAIAKLENVLDFITETRKPTISLLERQKKGRLEAALIELYLVRETRKNDDSIRFRKRFGCGRNRWRPVQLV